MNQAIIFSNYIKKSNTNDPCLVIIYLKICKICNNEHIKELYSNMAKNIYTYYAIPQLLSEVNWYNEKIFDYDLNVLFKTQIYYLNHNKNNNNIPGRLQYNINDQLNFRYEILGEIGKGAYSNVFKCYDHKRNFNVAVKCVRNDIKFKHSGNKEINLLKKINCNFICNFINYFNYNNKTCIVFNLYNNNLYVELKNRNFKPFSVEVVKKYTYQMINALCYLKDIQLIHCDIKPENTVIVNFNEEQEDMEIKLIDIGSAQTSKEVYSSYIQSRYYRSPEIIMHRGFDYNADLWSLGCNIYELSTGKPLFPSKNETNLIYDIYKVIGYPTNEFLSKCNRKSILFNQITTSNNIIKYSNFQTIKDLDDDLYDLLTRILKWDNRISYKDFIEHKYFKSLEI